MTQKTPDGVDFISATGVLILAANAIYGDPSETLARGKQNAAKIIDGILSTAVAGGFKQRDILETLLSRNGRDERTLAMAQAACDAADKEQLVSVIAGAMGSE
jgi:hypothetical protein